MKIGKNIFSLNGRPYMYFYFRLQNIEKDSFFYILLRFFVAYSAFEIENINSTSATTVKLIPYVKFHNKSVKLASTLWFNGPGELA